MLPAALAASKIPKPEPKAPEKIPIAVTSVGYFGKGCPTLTICGTSVVYQAFPVSIDIEPL
jgi:hypothetical protein